LRVRIGEMLDSSLVSSKLGEMQRAVIASPAYVASHGVPKSPADLHQHNCLSLGQQRGWLLRVTRTGGEVVSIKVSATLNATTARCCTNGRWPGKGWPGGRCGKWGDLANGRWCRCSMTTQAPPMGIFAVFPQRKAFAVTRPPVRVDHLKAATLALA
jgi:hypothetical protein